MNCHARVCKQFIFSLALAIASTANLTLATTRPAPAQTLPSTSAGKSTAVISSVAITQAPERLAVRVAGEGSLDFRASRMQHPDRLVLDFVGARLAIHKTVIPGVSAPVGDVRMGQYQPDVARVVVELTAPTSYYISRDGDAVVISLSAPKTTPMGVSQKSTLATSGPDQTSQKPKQPIQQANTAATTLATSAVQSPAPIETAARYMGEPIAPAGKAAALHFDGKTTGVERVGAPNQNSGESQINPTSATQPSVKPPQVIYEDGQLTIIAENSSLSDVMKALRAAMGVDIDLPASVADQRIWVHLGPGPARHVLRDLLDGTEFNYVFQASETDADGIRSVLLTQRSKSTGAETGPPERTAIRTMARNGSNAESGTDSENPPPEPVASGPVAVASGDPPQAPPPVSPANASSASLQNALSNSPGSALTAPTDPVQQIQMLQSMYEQRRQLQMQQNQKPAGQN